MLARWSFWILLGLREGPTNWQFQGVYCRQYYPKQQGTLPALHLVDILREGGSELGSTAWRFSNPSLKGWATTEVQGSFLFIEFGDNFQSAPPRIYWVHSPETNSLPLNIGHPKWKFHFLNHWFSRTMFILGRVGLLFRISSRWILKIWRLCILATSMGTSNRTAWCGVWIGNAVWTIHNINWSTDLFG